jgi:hypothetical protein
MAPKSDKRTRDKTVISADDPKDVKNMKLGSLTTALMLSANCAKLAPEKLTGLAVISEVAFPELIRSRKNGNNTYAAMIIAIINLMITLEVFSLVCIIIPPPSYLIYEPE